MTFCIITKNERDNLKKCLEAIRRFGPEADIVVVDTGSMDDSKEVAYGYTKNVYDFEWIDDFSAARNFCCDKVSDDIIVMIDSDEEIIECDIEAIETVYRKDPKAVGRLVQRNIIDYGGETSVADEYISRIFSPKYYRYEGRIHEQLERKDNGGSAQNGDLFDAPLVVRHTGYALSENERKKKANRNIKLLKVELDTEKDPFKRAYLLYQVGKSLYYIGDYEGAADFFSKTLSIDLDERLEFVKDAVASYGYALLNSGQKEKALELGGVYEYFKSDADYLFVLGLIYMNNARFDEAVDLFLQATRRPASKVEGVNSYKAYYNAGVIREVQGRIGEAKDYYSRCGQYEKARERLAKIKV